MEYSIIISYRDRVEHLTTLLPRLKEIFKDKKYEIIVAEQDDNDKFQKNSLYNTAFLSNPAANPTGFLKVSPNRLRSNRWSSITYKLLKIHVNPGIFVVICINENVK